MALTNAQKQKKHRKGQTALLRKIDHDVQIATAGVLVLMETIKELKEKLEKKQTDDDVPF